MADSYFGWIRKRHLIELTSKNTYNSGLKISSDNVPSIIGPKIIDTLFRNGVMEWYDFFKGNTMQRCPMTANGHKALQDELDHCRRVKRPQVIAAISEARAHGDLKENAEYHAAKEQQGFIEGRIKELEVKLSQAQVVDITRLPNQGKVIFGCTVHLLNLETNEEVIYQIVGEDEADLNFNKISYTSPIARAIIAKHIDDVVDVNTPKGFVSYQIITVEYK